GGRLYKTGDLVKRRTDGSIVYLGRIDTQVKIRGLRVELGEIETALTTHPAVAQAVVTVVTGPTGDRELAGYLRARPGSRPDPADLRAHLARTLPGYMIPAHLITVAEFPLNTSGKVNRAALPAPDQSSGPVSGAHVAPATRTESVVAGLYATVLGRRQVSATDSFFDLGGSSLQVMRLVDLIVGATGVDTGITAVFLHPTPRQLAASIDATASGAPGSAGSGPLVELSKGAGELPLHLIHPVGGTVVAYTQLARELAETFKVYGLEAPGLSQDAASASSLAELADDYAARISAAQPGGPYRLAGWSMGGVLAFEVARRLEQAGGDVCLLTLLDAPFAMPGSAPPARAQLAASFVADAMRSLGWDATAAPGPAAASADEQISWLAERLASDGADARGVADRLRRRLDVFGANVQVLAGYTPTGPAVQAPTLIVSASQSPNAPAREHWRGMLTGPVTTLCVDSDHYEFLRPPQVAEVAMAILKCHADSR
ncbi:MAG TPA: alpha/beta fold hydrolase, partial [Streptosporangiaceae bacterium]